MISRLMLAAVALAAAGAPAALARDLAVGMRDSDERKVVEQVLLEPFTKATTLAVQMRDWGGTLELLRSHKDPEAVVDLVVTRGDRLLMGCDEGVFEKLDWSAIGGKEHYLPAAVSDCGVGFLTSSTVLAWDRAKSPATPTWADFWDVAKIPGKRGLQRGPRTNLEVALLADNVPPGDVYRILRTSEGIERAFRKLDQIKPYAVWWETDADAVRILGSGEVLMTSAASGSVARADRATHRNFGIQWAGSLLAIDSWALVKGGPNQRQAYQLLYVAGSSAIQAHLAALTLNAGLAKGASEGLAPEVAAALPPASAYQGSALVIDEAFWRDNLDKLSQRFAAWLAR